MIGGEPQMCPRRIMDDDCLTVHQAAKRGESSCGYSNDERGLSPCRGDQLGWHTDKVGVGDRQAQNVNVSKLKHAVDCFIQGGSRESAMSASRNVSSPVSSRGNIGASTISKRDSKVA